MLSTVYVDDSATGLNIGTSWANAYTSLQAALTAAVAPQEIRVGQGTYKPAAGSDRTASFTLKNGVSVLGGYAGFGTPNPDARNIGVYITVLSGDIGVPGDTADNSLHVVVGGGTNSTAVLDGLTITAGNASGGDATGSDADGCGGGMYNFSSSPTLRNCTFTANSAIFSGGGMYNESSSPTLTNCTFTANSAGGGGGVYNLSVSSDATASPTLTNCTFSANSAGGLGGGMCNDAYSSDGPTSATLINCTFTANSADWGGGMINMSSSVTLTNCTFTANSASADVGGISNYSSSATLANCILWANAAPYGGQLSDGGDSTLVVWYSDIQGGYNGTGNINRDPQFVRNPNAGPDGRWGTGDDDYGNLRLRAFSPAVDAGYNGWVPNGVATDLAGNPRFADVPTVADTGVGRAPVVDMGAYEAVPTMDAEAGGPYAILEGGQVTLHGQGAGSHPGALVYEWDFDADGQYDDAVGPAPTFSASGIAGPQVLTVGLRVTDSASAMATDTAVVIVASAVAYVDDTAAGADNGTSWADAYGDLQAALAMSAPGQTIRVAQGTYKPTTVNNRTASFVLRSGVALYGGYAGWGAADPSARDVAQYVSALSGDIGATGDATDNSYHVVAGGGVDDTAVLDGFAITAGNANGSDAYGYDHGGGMDNSSSSPRLSNCTFTANSASSDGGGMYNLSSSPTLTNCTFTANSAGRDGGGVFSDSSSLALTNCTFIANSASGDGGGMSGYFSWPSTLTNCTLTANSAGDSGGGMYGYGSPRLTNSILWANTAPSSSQVYPSSGSSLVTYCDIQGGYNGAGNINREPQFVRNPSAGPDGLWGTGDDDYGDLRLRPFSPAVDAGNNGAVPIGVATDLAGNPRFADVPTMADTGLGSAPVVDLGAYEAVANLDAEAGGPYAVVEGGQVALHGQGASVQPGALVYEWDFDADGQYDDAVGPDPIFSASAIAGPQVLTIGLRVTDAASASVTDTAVVIIATGVAYVDDTAVGANNGTSWADAFHDLQAALAMSAPGQTIRVAQGTYKPTAGTSRAASFVLRSGVAVYGGYAGWGAADPSARDVAQYVSTLSGDIGTPGDATDNSFHVVVGGGADATAVLDGFAITGGNANGSAIYGYDRGGGMYDSSSSPRMTNCTFTANSASTLGGGIYNLSSSPTLSNCTFTANSAGKEGGAMYNLSSSPTLTDCTFIANSASSYGGGMYNFSSSSPRLMNCTFTANSAGSTGGGMYNSAASSALTNCTFTANSAGYGAGMYNSYSSSSTLTNCTFTANSASSTGGGMYNSASSPALTNCTFVANSASSNGGGMYNSAASPTLTNCTLVANSASSNGGGMYNSSASPALTNCILWANTAPSGSQIFSSGGTPVVTYSDIQGGYNGAGNKNLDPQFLRDPSAGPDATWRTADDDYGDLRLRLSSPCIDAGKNAALPAGTTTDMAGNARFVDVPATTDTGSGTAPLVDMGAYEAPAAPQALAGGPYRVFEGSSAVLAGAGYSPTGLAVSYAWDFDGDGQFDDATGASPVFSAAGMQGPQTLVIALRVTDTSGGAAVDTAVVLVVRPLYVDDSATGLNSGTSWANAYTGLQSALAAAVPGQVIVVAQGTYKPTTGADRAATFALKTGVAIYGGFAGYEAPDPAMRDPGLYPTILSGDVGTPGSTADNSYHVVVANGVTSSAVLDGFTITGGNANGSNSNGSGGGMYNSSSSPTLTNCTFTANQASSYGGGMYNDFSSPALTDCTFTANSATTYGGGIDNYASSPTLANCTFTANQASRGGGVYNSAGSPTLVNCTFAANSANMYGGGMYSDSYSTKLTNCILWANMAPSSSQVHPSSGSSVVTYSDIQGGYSGEGNINLDPHFVRNPSSGPDGKWGTADDDFGDLRLRPTSPCIDAGKNSAVPAGVTTDLAGNARFVDVPGVADTGSGTAPLVDIGAYEAPTAVLAEAGGPYRVIEGGSIVLAGAAYSPTGLGVSYAWDFDGDGQFDDATGPSPVFSAAGMQGPQTLVIALRVTDTSGATAVDTAVLFVLRPLYVDDSATGLNNGTSWADAYTDLQAALAAAGAQEICVAQGAYKPTAASDRTASFVLKNGVSILGGYAGFGSPDPWARNIALYTTILSGDIGTPGDAADNSYHVVVASGADSTAALDGCTITGGNANGSGSNAYGGGMYNTSSSPTLRNCAFIANSAIQNGGGVYNVLSSAPTLTDCMLAANWATSGGGMSNSSSSPTLTNCTLVANRATSGAGGVDSTSSSPTLTNCILWANMAANGRQIYNNGGTPVVTYCDIQGGYSGAGNINVAPQIVRYPGPGPDGTWGTVDDDRGDLRLRLSSPCIDAGKNSAVPAGITTDVAGNARFADVPARADTGSGVRPLVDMGPYEAPAAVQAIAGGPYCVIEGGSIVLAGAGYSPTGLEVSYAWDLDGDGQFDDADGPTPVFSAAGVQGAQTLVVALRVTDTSGATAIDTAVLRVVRPLYVDDSAAGLNNGTSWADAYTDLQAALAAAVPGQVIAVAQGTYKPTAGSSRDATFSMKNGVAIYGGFAGCGAPNPALWDVGLYASVLSGDVGAAGSTSDNSYHVVTASGTNSSAVLDGLTITGGNANGASQNSNGGGMYASGGSPTLINCTFSANSAGYGGGGMYDDHGFPTLTNCTFTANVANYGGGMYNDSSSLTLTDCAFNANSSKYSGGGMNSKLSSMTLSNCTFNANSTTSSGGGMYGFSSSATVSNCTFTANSASSGGGGIYNATGSPDNNSSSSMLTNCTFNANSAGGGGGGMYDSSKSPTLSNCTFVDNSAGDGGGMYASGGYPPTLTNCTFTANAASGKGGGMYNRDGMYTGGGASPTLIDCTFAANSAGSDGGGMYNDESNSPTLTNCTFVANRAAGTTTGGGGIYNYSKSLSLTNCAFVANSTSSLGGGIYNYTTTSFSATLTNCTFVANSAIRDGGGMFDVSPNYSAKLTNCILWANAARNGSQIYFLRIAPVVTYCDIQNGYTGTGNIGLAPQFVRNPVPGPDGTWGTPDDDYGDLRLRPNSPCIDAGQNSAVRAGITTDLAGNPRFVDVPATADTGSGTAPLVDMGAYEAPAVLQAVAGGPYRVVEGSSIVLAGAGFSPTGLAVSCDWDFDGDGQFDDASGPTPVFSAAGMLGPRTLAIALRVTDTSGATTVDSTELHVLRPLYVDDGAPGLNNGTSWANAYMDLQSALATAVPGDLIFVGQGTYKPTAGTNRSMTFSLRRGVAIYGGFAGYGAPDPAVRDVGLYASILSGDIGTANSTADNSYHVVTAGGMNASAVLDGVTITAGAADGSLEDAFGGGMYVGGGSPTLTNCTLLANSANSGGGMYINASFPTLTNCTFLANSANSGGGISNNSSSPTLTNCTFIANSAGTGGGMKNDFSNAALTNCTFAANAATYGGGTYNNYSSPTLANCILWANTASSGSQISGTGGTPVVTYCDVQGGYSGAGNTDLDPQFVRNPGPGPDGTWRTVDDDYGDLRLRPSSPCIDAGNNSAMPAGITTDLAGNPRFVDVPGVVDTGSGTAPLVDMGAYESPTPSLVVAGSDDCDDFSLSLSPDQASIRIVALGRSNTYSVLAILSLTIRGGEGDDLLTVDFSNGTPVPAGGVTFDGQAGSDCVRVLAPGNNATLTGQQVSVDTAAPIAFESTEGTSFDLGAGRLTKSGSSTAVLVGSNHYAGGTEVLEGTLVVGQGNALPERGSLTIGPGATVVLASGLNQAAVGAPRCAAVQEQAGGGQRQVDSGQWKVDSPLSTVRGLLRSVDTTWSTCIPCPEGARVPSADVQSGPDVTGTVPRKRSILPQDLGSREANAAVLSGPGGWQQLAREITGPNKTGTGTSRQAFFPGLAVSGSEPVPVLLGPVSGEQTAKKKAQVAKAVDEVLAALWR